MSAIKHYQRKLTEAEAEIESLRATIAEGNEVLNARIAELESWALAMPISSGTAEPLSVGDAIQSISEHDSGLCKTTEEALTIAAPHGPKPTNPADASSELVDPPTADEAGRPVKMVYESTPGGIGSGDYWRDRFEISHAVQAGKTARSGRQVEQSDEPERSTKLRDEKWLREMADLEDQHPSVSVGVATAEPDPMAAKPACLKNTPAVLCESKIAGDGICVIWAFGLVVSGFVRTVDTDGLCQPEDWHTSQLTPTYHDPEAAELRRRIEEAGSK